jgi:tetratricopeptide (TPR) repeat protein
MVRKPFVVAALLLAALPSMAQAAWREASSAHFVVYAEDTEKDLREFTLELERFHSALELITAEKLGTPSPSNRVTIYVVDNQRQVGSLYGDGGRFIGGFYIPRAGGSIAIVPHISDGLGNETDESMITLLHEYTHHFVISTSAFPLPRWLSEGGAEFFAAASFEKDGAVGIGRPANHRAGELFMLAEMPIEQLLDDKLYFEKRRSGYDSYYGWAWLLYHYMTFAPERQGQFGKYIAALAAGRSSLDAARDAFGDLKKLDKDLSKYLNGRSMTYLKLKPEMLSTGAIQVRALSPGASEIMPVRIRSKVGVTREMAIKALPEVRKIAARYPKDAFVLAALAEAEHDTGNYAEAIAAADAAIAADPNEVNAYVQKGYSLFALAEDADDADAAYKKAMAPFTALNRIENDHPLPLIYYFRSFAGRGTEPPDLALRGLERASQLAPFDRGLLMSVAMEQLRRGKFAEARRNLAPIAFDPHAGGAGRMAQALITRLDAEGDPPTQEEVIAISRTAAANDAADGEPGENEKD